MFLPNVDAVKMSRQYYRSGWILERIYKMMPMMDVDRLSLKHRKAILLMLAVLSGLSFVHGSGRSELLPLICLIPRDDLIFYLENTGYVWVDDDWVASFKS